MKEILKVEKGVVIYVKYLEGGLKGKIKKRKFIKIENEKKLILDLQVTLIFENNEWRTLQGNLAKISLSEFPVEK